MKQMLTIIFSCIVFCGVILSQSKGIPGQDFSLFTSPQEIQEVTSDEILTTLTWTSLTSSTHAVSRSCCAFITIGGNDYVYQFGGGSGSQYTTVARYDVAANTWSTGFAPIPSNMSAASAVTVDDMIYLFGGESTGGLGKTYMYDPVANTWTAKANMLTLVTDALVVKFEYGENYVYVIGGGDGLFGATVFNSVQLYDVAANTYTACTSLPSPVTMMGGGMLNYTIIATGGWNGGAGNSVTYKGEVNPSNLTQITWTTIASYPAGGVTRMASFPVTFGTFPSAAGIFCTGGAIDGGTLTGATHLYNFCTEQWEVLTPNLSQPRSNFKGCGKKDNIVYVIAGFTTVGVGTSDKATLADITGNCYTPVPVELISFNANSIDGVVELSWITATETNNQGFSIEKSQGSGFETIGFVQGHGTTTETQVYSFVDRNVNVGTYTYRLKQIDYDGSYEYSNIVEVNVSAPGNFTLEQNYPNPFNPSTSIEFKLKVDSKVSLKVFDVLGQEVANLVNANLAAGSHHVDFDASALNTSVYLYRLEATGIAGTNFVDVKKMILTK
jgi:hypothetical protein